MPQETNKRLLHSRLLAVQVRINALRAIASFGAGHVGGSMSMADLLGILYGGAMNVDPSNPDWEERDYLICSKGHAGPGLYGALSAVGYFPEEELDRLNAIGGMLPSHCDRRKTPGVDMSTGSLGQGLSVAAGLAFGMKLQKKTNRVFCIVGDGESQEGQIWEAVMFAGHNKLDNLIVFIDHNNEQVDGYLHEVNDVGNFSDRLKSFRWNTLEIDGHDAEQIWASIDRAAQCKGRPTAIVMHTKKGKGCRFAEGTYNHSMNVEKQEAEAAVRFLKEEWEGLKKYDV
jgi:transketolase